MDITNTWHWFFLSHWNTDSKKHRHIKIVEPSKLFTNFTRFYSKQIICCAAMIFSENQIDIDQSYIMFTAVCRNLIKYYYLFSGCSPHTKKGLSAENRTYFGRGFLWYWDDFRNISYSRSSYFKANFEWKR